MTSLSTAMPAIDSLQPAIWDNSNYSLTPKQNIREKGLILCQRPALGILFSHIAEL
jgi:hypothetical protein